MNSRNIMLKASLAVCCLGLVFVTSDGVQAADHNEAPGTMEDAAADIADYYAWFTDDKLIVAVTFAGLTAPGGDATYDTDVRYSVHIDHDFDNAADIDIDCYFAQSTGGANYVSCDNVPGADNGRVWGPVDTNIDGGGGAMLYAGPREDPFFMDFDGFVATLGSGELMFDPANDTFAGTNVTAIVIEMDRAAAAADGTVLQTWTTTARR